jgi:antiphage defense system Thoeris ThsB-like protein
MLVLNQHPDFKQGSKRSMAKTKVFTSFDFDHDEDLRNLLVGQAKNPDSPFEMTDSSLKEPLTGDWKAKVRTRIKRADQVIVLCGEHTDTARGVSAELQIAQEERVPYFLLAGRKDKTCKKPTAALSTDKMYNWTWDNLKALIGGGR